MPLTIARRIGEFLLTTLIASIAVYLLLAVIPGDPAQVALGPTASADALAAKRHELGLDRPLWIRYLEWIAGVARADFGVSAITGRPIGPDILNRLTVTLTLVLCGTILALLISIPAGIIAAVRARRPDGVIISFGSQIGLAIPGFLAGIALIMVFGVWLRVLPTSGWVAPTEDFGAFLQHAILPALALGSLQAAILTRFVRSAVLEIRNQDFIRTARSKGLTPMGALVRHGLRNAAIPVLTVVGLQLGALLIGAVVVEQVFVIRGVGALFLDRIANRDMVAVQGITIVLVLAVLLINLIVDLLYAVIDPRLRKAA